MTKTTQPVLVVCSVLFVAWLIFLRDDSLAAPGEANHQAALSPATDSASEMKEADEELKQALLNEDFDYAHDVLLTVIRMAPGRVETFEAVLNFMRRHADPTRRELRYWWKMLMDAPWLCCRIYQCRG